MQQIKLYCLSQLKQLVDWCDVIVLGPPVEAAQSAACVSHGNLLRISYMLRDPCAHAAIDSCSNISSVAQATADYYCPHDGNVYEVRR